MEISVIMPVKERLNHAFVAIRSVLDQSLGSFELILVDDGSAEEVEAFLYTVRLRYSNVRVLKNDRKPGANSCRNIGFEAAVGEYVVFLDSDDILAPFCLERRVATMNARPELDFMAYSCLLYHDLPLDRYIVWNRKNEHGLLDRFLSHDAPFQTSGPIWRKSSLTRLKLYWDEDLVGWQDWKFHVSALLSGAIGELCESIDYFWNQPKKNSVTRATHNTSGRINRMDRLDDLAWAVGGEKGTRIRASIIWLASRVSLEGKVRATLHLWKLFKGKPSRNDAAFFVLFDALRLPLSNMFRGFFRKRLIQSYPDLDKMMKHSNTYKLPASVGKLNELIERLNEYSNFQKRFW